MKPRLRKHHPGAPGSEAFLVQCCGALDRSIPGLGTTFIIAGLVGSVAQAGHSADFLFVTGLLFHIAIWFEHWWVNRQKR